MFIFVWIYKRSNDMRRPEILRKIADAVRKAAPGAQAIVYGSEARGDARPDSDIDLLILIDGNQAPTPEEELNLRRPLTELEVQTGVDINALVVLRRLWEQMASPFAINVNREGFAL